MPPVSSASGPAAVTGASGYIGAMLVQNLVQHGYTVRACVRDVADRQKTAHLLAMNNHGWPGCIQLCQADLMTEGSYDELFRGCAVVFHVAAVLERDHAGGMAGSGRHAGEDTPQAIYDGGVVAMKHVLASVSKNPSVKRLVYTSSTAAVMHPAEPGYQFTESDWASDKQKPGTWTVNAQPYAKSKVDAECLAYEWADKHGTFDVVSHCPCHVLGPLMCKHHHEIWQLRIGKLVEGKELERMCWNITDTRDIAEAQRLSAESLVARNGSRYACVRNPDEPELFVHEIQARLQVLYPQYDIGVENANGTNRPRGPICNNALMREELGIVPHSVDDTLKVTVDSLIALGFITPRLKSKL